VNHELPIPTRCKNCNPITRVSPPFRSHLVGIRRRRLRRCFRDAFMNETLSLRNAFDAYLINLGGLARIGDHDGRFVATRRYKLAHAQPALPVFAADDDAVGIEEVATAYRSREYLLVRRDGYASARSPASKDSLLHENRFEATVTVDLLRPQAFICYDRADLTGETSSTKERSAAPSALCDEASAHAQEYDLRPHVRPWLPQTNYPAGTRRPP